jgi:hypothetical protein
MDNNNIHPDEMDRLLRETFLNGPDSETDQVADMMAQHVYSTNWNMTPPIEKVQNFIPKKGFFQVFSLNIFIGTAIAIVAGTGLFFVLKDPKNVNQPQSQTTLPQEDKLPVVPIVDTASNTEEPVEISIKKTIKAKPKTVQDIPPPIIVEQVDSQKTMPKQTASNEPKKKEFRPEKPRNLLYVLIPYISPQERMANEKRKKDMVRQLSVFDKKVWSYIPMGTTHINGETVSLQAFYILKYEVSNVQYRTFLYDLILTNKLHEYRRAAVYDSGWVTKSNIELFAKEYFWNPKYDNLPVVNITAEGAQMFCYWLTTEVNKIMEYRKRPYINDVRLPQPSEWIYAAKGGNDTAVYAWGGPFYRNSRGMILGNFQGERSLNNDDGVEILAAVNSFFPNDWGMYNMSGNVAEMTAPYADRTILVKGGAWNRGSEFMKLLHENKISLYDLPTTNVGFRPVVTFVGNIPVPTSEKENNNK